jgi:hypothetical protein
MPGVKPWMRKVGGALLLVGAVLIGAKLLDATSHGPVPVEIHYLLGDPPVAAALEVLFAPEGGGPAVARFETQLVSSDVKQITRLPAGRHVMDITMISRSGARRSVRRSIEASRGVVIRLDLRRETAP